MKKFKSGISFILCLLMVLSLFSFSVFAEGEDDAEAPTSGTCGSNLTWTLDEEGTLTITGSGAMNDYETQGSPWYASSLSVRSIVMNGQITNIGNYAFEGCYLMTDATIPTSVTKIGNNAFQNCILLKEIALPANLKTIGTEAFSGCLRLASITIPNGVTAIPESAFAGCILLSSVTLPSNLTSIGAYAFSACGSLTAFTIPAGVTNIGEEAFYGCLIAAFNVDSGNKNYTSENGVLLNKSKTELVAYPAGKADTEYTVPSNVTKIGDGAFAGNTILTKVTIPSGVTTIGTQAFATSIALTTVTIPSTVTTIGDGAFYGCTALTSITIPNGVTTIGDSAFYGCTSLTSVTIPTSVTSIGADVFTGCTSLTDINFDGTAEQWAAYGVTLPENAVVHTTHTHKYTTSTVAPTCTEGGYTLHSCECGESYKDTYTAALGHSYDAGVITTPATEETTGIKTYTCTRCGATKTETIPKQQHTHKYNAVTVAPTCTSQGYTVHVCSCGETYNDNYVASLGHAWDAGRVTKEATEETTGEKIYTCTRCGDTRTEIIPVLAHTHKYTTTVIAPTCTEQGYTHHSCTCGVDYDDTYTAALGHAWDNGIVTLEPTEESIGVLLYTCTRCGETKTEILPVLEHTHKYVATVVEPTCTEQGYTYYFCPCGDSYFDSYVAALGHTWDEGHLTKTPTANETGELTYACTVCGETRKELLPVVNMVDKPVISSISNTTSGVQVKWGAVEGAEKYRVFKKVSGKWTALIDTTETTYTDTTVASGNSYTYTVRCITADGYAYASSFDSTGKTIKYIAAPEASVSNVTNGVQVSWGAVTGAENYRVFKKVSGAWKALGDTTATSFTDKTAVNGETYTYTVRCISADGKTYTSSFDSTGKTITFKTAQLATPAVAVENATNGVKVSWSAVAGAEKYRVFKKISGKWTALTDTTATSYVDTTVTSGTSYTYTVRCVSEDGKTYTSSFDSTGKTITYKAAQLATPAVTVENATNGVKVSWGAVSGAEKYRVFKKVSGKWTALTDTTATSYVDTTVTKGSTYVYTVRCINAAGTAYTSSFDSAGKTITFGAQFGAPVVTVANAATGVQVKWGAISGAEKYRVFKKVDGKWTSLGDTTSTSFTDKTAVSGESYTYTVRCISADGKTYTSSFDSTGKTVKYIAAPTFDVTNTTNGVKVTWDEVNGAVNYRVFKKVAGKWTELGDTTATTFTDTTAVSGESYTYTVRCINAAGTAYTSSFNSTGKTITYK